MSNLVIALVVLPFFGSVFCLVEKVVPRLRVSAWATFLCTVLCIAALAALAPGIRAGNVIVYDLGGFPAPLGIALHMNRLAWISSAIGMGVALLAAVFAWGEREYRHDFYFFFLMMVGGMQGVILTDDLFNMFVFVEILSLASYVLIAYSGKGRSLLASFRYLLVSSVGIGLFLVGILVLYSSTGTVSMSLIGQYLRRADDGLSSGVLLGIVCFIVGIGIKAAFVPFHTWLPDAHSFAPHPVSAILSGVMIKVTFLAVWRIVVMSGAESLYGILMWTGALTALLGAVFAFSQTDVKRILAFHSISQMGYIVASFGTATAVGRTASLAHVLSHSVFKSLLFLTLGTVVHATGRRDLRQLGGLATRMPLVCVCFAIGALSICGIPPFNGFVSKNLISLSLKDHTFAYPLILLAAIGTVASFTKLSTAFGGRSSLRYDAAPLKKATPAMYVPLVVLAFLCLITGILPSLSIRTLSFLATGSDSGLPPESLSPYTASNLLMTGITLASGVAVYAAGKIRVVGKALERVRAVHPGLEASLILVVVGFVALTIMTWVLEGSVLWPILATR